MTATVRLSVAAGLATVLASLSLLPVTDMDPWLLPSFVAVVLIVAVGRLGERYRVPSPVVPVAQLAAAAWLIVLVHARDVTFLDLFPTRAAFVELAELHQSGLEGVREYAAPTPPDRGVELLCLEGIALIALVVDVLAVQLRRAPLAGLPLLSMYAVAAAVVDGGVPWLLFVLLAVGYLVLLVADGRLRVSQWGRSVTASANRPGGADSSTMTRSGERVGAVAIALAVAVPALFPGLSDGVFGRGGVGGVGSGSQTIRTTNPIVDLKRDLVQPDEITVMRYTTDAPTPEYIRVVTLDSFNGDEWRTSNRAVPSSQRVSRGLPAPPGLGPDVPAAERRYEFRVTDDFSSPWLPLPYPTRRIAIDGDWRYDVGSLDVVARRGTSQGKRYEVTSLEVRPAAGQLQTSTVDEELGRLVGLPEATVALIQPTADEVTQGAETPFDRAVALQQWFRSEFSYSLDRRPGSSTRALQDFLEEKSGYCEQFAATMAIMARSLGIPARVGVGYLPGIEQDGTWTVTSRDSHAWPELYFDSVGWVRFEPTPAQRTGGAPSWTLPPTGPSTASPVAPVPGGATPEAAPQRPDPLEQTDQGVDAGAVDSGSQVPWRWIISGVAVLGALALPAVAALVNRRLRWHRAAGNPVLEAQAAWDDLRNSARDAGLGWDPAATPRGAGVTIIGKAGLMPSEGELVGHVVGVAERARYAPSAPPFDGLREDSDLLRRTLLSAAPPQRRVFARLYPATTRDLASSIGERLADAFDWVDAAGGKLRRKLTGWIHRS
jgi:transglutaminase-like putative cysteine protease